MKKGLESVVNAKQRENEWDNLLGIKTSGRDDSQANSVNFPYEPTDYTVLERFANSGYVRKNNCLLDYGCGKGRVGFYMSYQTRCRYIGIDYDAHMIECAFVNRSSSVSGSRTEFICENAGKYTVPAEVDRVYFFNPFSNEILEQVLVQLKNSNYENPREILLFFYYPSDDYVARLMIEDELEFVDEISCEDMFEKYDERERIMIFRMLI